MDPVDRPEQPSVQVESITVNEGRPDRSFIESIEVMFSNQVELGTLDEVFSVVNDDDETTIENNHVSAVDLDGKTQAQLTFSGAGTLARPAMADSVLSEGDFRLVIDATHVRVSGTTVTLDGDLNGVVGGNHFFGDDYDDALFAMFGDGDGSVALSDSAQLRSGFGLSIGDLGYQAGLDANADGVTDLADFAVFRSRFGNSR